MDATDQLPAISEPQSEDATVMAMLSKAVSDGRDIATVEKLMDLQERVLNRNAKNAFAADFVRMRPNLPRVLRSKPNTQTKSKYAPLEDINAAIDPILEKYGFSTSTKVVAQTEASVTVKAELWHKYGHVEETQITMPLDKTGIAGTVNKTGPHALSSSVTYAKRVAICALLNVSTGDDVDGNIEPETIDTEEAARIDTLIRETNADRAKFLKYMGIQDLFSIKKKDYQKAIDSLNKKAKSNAA